MNHHIWICVCTTLQLQLSQMGRCMCRILFLDSVYPCIPLPYDSVTNVRSIRIITDNKINDTICVETPQNIHYAAKRRRTRPISQIQNSKIQEQNNTRKRTGRTRTSSMKRWRHQVLRKDENLLLNYIREVGYLWYLNPDKIEVDKTVVFAQKRGDV